MYKWIPIIGKPMKVTKDSLVFHGGVRVPAPGEFSDTSGAPEPQEVSFMTLALCDKPFTGGMITARVTFTGEVSMQTCFDFVLHHDVSTGRSINVGIPSMSFPAFALREFAGGKWTQIAWSGDKENSLEAGRAYSLSARVDGSVVSLSVDGIDVLRGNVLGGIPHGPVGLFCINQHDIEIRDYEVRSAPPRAFVVMQFSDEFEDIYGEVIKQVCASLGVDVRRMDETRGPGIITADISAAILESAVIIADITPANPNVYYEVGYAHGVGKPTILMARRGTPLPFDVSPFRTLFYDDSIGGKTRVEEALREYIMSALGIPTDRFN